MRSIKARLLVVGSVVLLCFALFTGLTLDRAFQRSAEAAVKERLRVHTYSLIGIADVDANGTMNMPSAIREARFNQAQSGLYAQVNASKGGYRWKSGSLIGVDVPFYSQLSVGEIRFDRLRSQSGEEVFVFGFGINWETESGEQVGFTFNVAESLTDYYAQLNNYQRNLWGWLVGLTVILTLVQFFILRWGLAPLRQVTEDLMEIESGRQPELSGDYPTELAGLTKNINRLIHNERANLGRYRDTLGDLAHSLKTPLSVLRSVMENPAKQTELRHTVAEQTDRMTNIVNYQLQRAVASGHVTFAAPISITVIVRRVLDSLVKVYGDKHIKVSSSVKTDLQFPGDEGDLLEVFGNLLDNAHKWAKSVIEVNVDTLSGHGRRGGIRIVVSDDGPGVDPLKAEQVLQRGVRADTRVDGHGIGLSIVKEIVLAYQGSINISPSRFGGACFSVCLLER